MKKCNAYVQKTNTQCQKKALIGSNYCFLHYQKKEMIISVVIGALLGFIITNIPIWIIKARKDIGFYATYCKYDKYEYKKIFNSFLEKRKEFFEDNDDNYVFNLNIHNKTRDITLRDLNLFVNTEAPIFACEEYSSVGVVNIKSYFNAPTFIPKENIGISQRILNIDKVGPGGFVNFAILAWGLDWIRAGRLQAERAWFARYKKLGESEAESRAKPRTLGGASVPARTKTRHTLSKKG